MIRSTVAARGWLVAVVFAFVFACIGGVTGALGCSAPGGPGATQSWDWGPQAGGDAGTLPVASSSLTCTPARASLPLPARSTVMSADASGVGETQVFTEDLFNLFKGNCGGCHVAASLGNFHVTSLTFASVVDQHALDLITSDDPTRYMPPAGAGGAAYSSRSATDPIAQLASLLTAWIAQGRPDALFTLPSTNDSASSGSYALPSAVGLRLTNIGDCVPTKSIVGSSVETMTDLDAFFAEATQLPDTLAQTDLTTLDGTALAELGVISYAPQYPLWSDDAGKLRHIRLPRGQSVKFDNAAQRFDIPPNTRFYKTFLKKVIDRDGNERYRKIETRLIVARPDRTLADGTVEPQALFGSYIWSDDEMSASLSNITLNDHTGFTDRLLEYTLDEPTEQAIVDSMPANLKYAIESGATGLKRHYAIPGSPRCVQCHMGSATQDFVLGFLPLQIARRADATGGAYESTGADELTQMQRFIDYGIVTGMATPADVIVLEEAEGTRKPRNGYELQAQAYMLGNCAHCHNPRGYPSVKSPVLRDALDFLPSATGGVFQFPLDRTSPLRSRGIDQDVPIPYITPSLREYPVASEPTPNWTPKWVTCQVSSDPSVNFLCDGRTQGTAHLSAPWRSLIYRNVDTPFMYADDLAIFPHMPMNTPGYDCRVAPIMGDWMVSIPAARKSPDIDEDRVPGGSVGGVAVAVDANPQPYVEVAATDPGYGAAMAAASARLQDYHTSKRYGFCPDTSDIVDPAVIAAGGGYPLVPSTDVVADPAHPGEILQPAVGVPTRAHWVVTDLTDPLGDWYPRRTGWSDVLVKDVVDTTDLPVSADTRELELAARQTVLDEIEVANLTPELKSFVLQEQPFGLWQQSAACNFAAVPKVSDFVGEARPQWMSATSPAATAPVYMQSPGAAVFTNICINCHGPEADSKGLLADALSNMTGGTGRVANFRSGLFGPVDSPGGNRVRVFGPFATTDPAHPPVTTDDWAARYMAWMALGGTLIHVPDALLNIVATTPVIGVRRSRHLAATVSPNMLKLAQALCAQVLVPDDVGESPRLDEYFYSHGRFDWTNQTGLIDSNGDAQMWQRLCTMGNRTVVRVPWVASWSMVGQVPPSIVPSQSLYYGDGGAYPAGAPVLDDRGRLTSGIQPDNAFPMCFRRPVDAQQRALADQYLAAHPVGGAGGVVIPYCPDSLFGDPKLQLESTMNDMVPGGYQLTGADRWAARGAINAGFAVFLYLDELVKGHVSPKPPFNHCEQL